MKVKCCLNSGLVFLVAALACVGVSPAAEPAKVIFDTDMLTDYDDVGALACLHALADAGECEILATLSCTRDNASVAAIEVINAYYGRAELPVGAPRGIGVSGPDVKPGNGHGHEKYRKLVRDYSRWVRHPNASDAPDANGVYRKVLAAQTDKSVVICSVGFLTNLRRLLETPGDEHSPLNGRDLVAKKVRRWVCMGCAHPRGKEYNIKGDPQSSRIVFERWPTRREFADFAYGFTCYAGRAVADLDVTGNPVRDLFKAALPSADKIAENLEQYRQWGYSAAGRAAWDEVTVLLAVRGPLPLFGRERGTYRVKGNDGVSVWEPSPNSSDFRIVEKMPKAEVGKVIDDLMCRKSMGTDPILQLPFVGASGPSDVVSFTCSPCTRTSWAVVEGRSGTSSPVRIERSFHLVGDGKARRYWFDCANPVAFDGNGAVRLKPKGMESLSSITVSDAFTGEKVPLTDVVFAKDKPDIPGELCLSATDVPLAFNRVGQEFPVEIGLFNPGTAMVKGARCEISGLAEGVRVVDPVQAAAVIDLPGWGSALHRIVLTADRPCVFTLKAVFSVPGREVRSVDVPVRVGPSLGLLRADYVPEPKPLAKGKYEIGAFYFCDWVRADQWMKVWRMDPKRKPALGWYDNRRSEVLDWQIKWSVENGISYWLVDWYGSKEWHPAGSFEQALSGARYRKYIRWALMWCNHMPPGKSREEAWTALVELWIRKYFGASEYMRVDGMPYVSIWDPDRLDADNGGAGGCRRMLEKARAMARAAGYKGIFFQAMNNDDTGTGVGASRLQEKRREQGFDETTNYHFLGTGDRRIGPREKRYADNVSMSPIYWETVRRIPGIRYLPNLSTGWDDRPWNDTMRMTGKSPAEFRRLCTLAKAFSDRTGIRRFCLGPLNEWGEGSYVEPNGEFGFGFYEAIRETFFAKPAEGWPLNCTPSDVGRGPYPVPDSDGVVPQTKGRQWR